MGRKINPRVIIVIDFGGSMTKTIVNVEGIEWLLNMEPETMAVSKELINDYQCHKIGVALPCDRAGVGMYL